MENTGLKKAGLKATLPRIKILEMLEHSDKRHWSAEDVYKALLESGEDVGLATVYRVLTQFESAGLVTRHNFETGRSVFELKQGPHHDHMLCVKCGTIAEFTDDVIEERQKAIAERLGWVIKDHTLVIYGLCPKCQREEA
ncbi:MAG: ferric iron uptake transcriptional regulator [Gammaproteobacteria bacterium]|nr:MAG: ferric iron uptake transcriptional regulator [Gammaproteobacteria bacterium]